MRVTQAMLDHEGHLGIHTYHACAACGRAARGSRCLACLHAARQEELTAAIRDAMAHLPTNSAAYKVLEGVLW